MNPKIALTAWGAAASTPAERTLNVMFAFHVFFLKRKILETSTNVDLPKSKVS